MTSFRRAIFFVRVGRGTHFPGMRSARVTPTAAGWYQATFDREGWSCHKDKATLVAEGKLPTHFFMDGHQRREGRLVHCGVGYVPEEHMNIFRDSIAKSAPGIVRYIHEIAGDWHSAFFDLDFKVHLTPRAIELIQTIVDDAGFGSGLEGCELLFKDHQPPEIPEHVPKDKLPRFRHALRADGEGILFNVLRRKFPLPPDHGWWTWSQVLECMREPECLEDAPELDGPVLIEEITDNPHVMRPIFVLFQMAMASQLLKMVHAFYPGLPASAQTFMTFVLSNYDGIEKRINIKPTQKDGYPLFNLSCHVIIRNLVVTDDTSLWMRQTIVDTLAKRYRHGLPRGMSAEGFWSDVLDANPYSAMGGLRMFGQYKVKICPACKSDPKKTAKCGECMRKGKLHVDTYYGQTGMLHPDGRLVCGTKWWLSPDEDPQQVDGWANEPKAVTWQQRYDKFMKSKVYATRMTSLRVPRVHPVTPGVCLEGKSEPRNLTFKVKSEMAVRVGDAAANRMATKAAAELKLPEDHPKVGHLLATINNFETAWETEARQGRPPPVKERQYYAKDDPRFLALERDFPELATQTFNFKPYRKLKVKSATLVRGDELYINVTGPAASRCFNRTVDTMDTEIHQDLLPEYRGKKGLDDVGMGRLPGRHTLTKDCIYFVMKRRREGVITQKCYKQTAKTNRRTSLEHPQRKPMACSAWDGRQREVPEGSRRRVRNFFYTPDDQTETECRRLVLLRAKEIARKRKQGIRDEFGPTETYDQHAQAAEAAVRVAKKAKTGDVIYEDIFKEGERPIEATSAYHDSVFGV